MSKPLLITVVLICTLLSCKKLFNTGTASAQYNGLSWKPDVEAYTNNSDQNSFDLSFRIKTSRDEEHSFTIRSIPKTPGKYVFYPLNAANTSANKRMASYLVVEGGDVICDTYKPKDQDTLVNYVTVEKTNGRSVSGTFSANLFVDLPKCSSVALDSIFLRNGVYEVRIRN